MASQIGEGTHQQKDAAAFAGCVRESVRRESAYLVPGHGEISVKLNQNECPFDLPTPVKQELLQQLLESDWHRYPSEFSDRLRSALGESIGVSADSLILGNGSNELAQFLGHALIQPGQSVVVLDPMFSLFEKIVRLCDGVPVRVPCEDDYTTDAQKVIDNAGSTKAGLVIVASPNNPTGKAIPVQELARIAANVDGMVLIDEAYHEFVPGDSALSLLGEHPNVMVMRTFSKTVGLAGLRLGYLVTAPVIAAELLKARLPFMINRLTEIVAGYLIRHPEIVDQRVSVLTSERGRLFDALQQMTEVEVVPSTTNFLIFQTPLESRELVGALARHGVLIRDVSGYPRLPRFVRVNVGAPSENNAFLSALNDVLFSAGEPAA